MATLVSNRLKRDLLDGAANLDAAVVKVLLTKAAAVTDPDLDFVSDVLATSVDELTDGSYVRKTLASQTVSLDDTNDRGLFDADDITWTALAGGETVTGALVYREVTNDADSPWYVWYDLTDTATNGLDFVLQWATAGLAEVVQG